MAPSEWVGGRGSLPGNAPENGVGGLHQEQSWGAMTLEKAGHCPGCERMLQAVALGKAWWWLGQAAGILSFPANKAGWKQCVWQGNGLEVLSAMSSSCLSGQFYNLMCNGETLVFFEFVLSWVESSWPEQGSVPDGFFFFFFPPSRLGSHVSQSHLRADGEGVLVQVHQHILCHPEPIQVCPGHPRHRLGTAHPGPPVAPERGKDRCHPDF